jgi:hypothetical protein
MFRQIQLKYFTIAKKKKGLGIMWRFGNLLKCNKREVIKCQYASF